MTPYLNRLRKAGAAAGAAPTPGVISLRRRSRFEPPLLDPDAAAPWPGAVDEATKITGLAEERRSGWPATEPGAEPPATARLASAGRAEQQSAHAEHLIAQERTVEPATERAGTAATGETYGTARRAGLGGQAARAIAPASPPASETAPSTRPASAQPAPPDSPLGPQEYGPQPYVSQPHGPQQHTSQPQRQPPGPQQPRPRPQRPQPVSPQQTRANGAEADDAAPAAPRHKTAPRTDKPEETLPPAASTNSSFPPRPIAPREPGLSAASQTADQPASIRAVVTSRGDGPRAEATANFAESLGRVAHSPRAEALAPVIARAAALGSAPPSNVRRRVDGDPQASMNTEVTVTIGRLEVRAQPAVSERSAQTRPPRRRPSSLDEYLRSRSTGRSG